MTKELIKKIIEDRWKILGQHSTYRTICLDFKRAYPEMNLRESTIERFVRKLAQENKIIRIYPPKGDVVFIPNVPKFELNDYLKRKGWYMMNADHIYEPVEIKEW